MHNKRLRELHAIVPLNNITKKFFFVKSHEEKIVKLKTMFNRGKSDITLVHKEKKQNVEIVITIKIANSVFLLLFQALI